MRPGLVIRLSYPTIPSIPISREPDGRYEVDGRIIAVDGFLSTFEWEPSFSQTFTTGLGHDTTDFPVGLYRFYVEYKRLFTDGGGVIETATIDFEIR